MSQPAYVHIGLPKTGTSYIQQVLWTNAVELRRQGFELLGQDAHTQRSAVLDLLGRRVVEFENVEIEGAWSTLAADAGRVAASRVLISDETLIHARKRDARRLQATLAPREVHLVVTVRDLARAIVSMWQEDIRKGRTIRWGDYVAAVRDPDSGPPTAGVAFWLRYDLPARLEAWSSIVPAEHIHVVTVPPPGTHPSVLPQRFSSAVDIDPTGLELPQTSVHQGLDAQHAEVCRRLNAELREQLTAAQYRTVMRRVIMPTIRRDEKGPAIGFPEQHRGWVTERSDQLVDRLSRGGFALTGDWADLRPAFETGPTANPDDLGDDELLATETRLLAGVLGAQMRSQPRARAAPSEHPPDGTRASLRWSSRVRSARFSARVHALELADRHPLVAKAANSYLRRTGRSTRS